MAGYSGTLSRKLQRHLLLDIISLLRIALYDQIRVLHKLKTGRLFTTCEAKVSQSNAKVLASNNVLSYAVNNCVTTLPEKFSEAQLKSCKGKCNSIFKLPHKSNFNYYNLSSLNHTDFSKNLTRQNNRSSLNYKTSCNITTKCSYGTLFKINRYLSVCSKPNEKLLEYRRKCNKEKLCKRCFPLLKIKKVPFWRKWLNYLFGKDLFGKDLFGKDKEKSKYTDLNKTGVCSPCGEDKYDDKGNNDFNRDIKSPVCIDSTSIIKGSKKSSVSHTTCGSPTKALVKINDLNIDPEKILKSYSKERLKDDVFLLLCKPEKKKVCTLGQLTENEDEAQLLLTCKNLKPKLLIPVSRDIQCNQNVPEPCKSTTQTCPICQSHSIAEENSSAEQTDTCSDLTNGSICTVPCADRSVPCVDRAVPNNKSSEQDYDSNSWTQCIRKMHDNGLLSCKNIKERQGIPCVYQESNSDSSYSNIKIIQAKLSKFNSATSNSSITNDLSYHNNQTKNRGNSVQYSAVPAVFQSKSNPFNGEKYKKSHVTVTDIKLKSDRSKNTENLILSIRIRIPLHELKLKRIK